jgi:SAM-dependent methyltransferase
MTACDPAPGWFRRHFNEDYLLIYGGRDQAQADLEAARILAELEIRPGQRVLDLCCGFGRHLAAFAKHRVDAVGADLSMPLLARVEPRDARRVVCADMRSLPFPGGKLGFSAVVNFFTSFGYFESDEENLAAAREMARVIQPGGRFSMDLMNAGVVVRGLEPRTERAAGPFRVTEVRRYDATRRRIEKEIALRREGCNVEKRYLESVRVFSPGEIRELLTAAGLLVDRMLGDFSGGAYSERSLRMIVLGGKPS